MGKYRTNTNDAPERLPPTVAVTGGALPAHRVPVVVNGQRVGHVSAATGSAATALRLGAHHAKLTKIDGRLSWAGEASGNIRRRQAIQHAQRVEANKGSVARHATPPETSARPKRGH